MPFFSYLSFISPVKSNNSKNQFVCLIFDVWLDKMSYAKNLWINTITDTSDVEHGDTFISFITHFTHRATCGCTLNKYIQFKMIPLDNIEKCTYLTLLRHGVWTAVPSGLVVTLYIRTDLNLWIWKPFFNNISIIIYSLLKVLTDS